MTNDSPTTQPSLIARLRNRRDNQAWADFIGVYTPLVFGFLRRRGLQDADAADVTQDVFQAVSKSIESFRQFNGSGSFRGWLLTVTRHKLCDHADRKNRQVQGSGDTTDQQVLAAQPVTSEEQAIIEREFRQRLWEKVCKIVQSEFRKSTWLAFHETQVNERAASDVAAELEMSVESVYVARSRVLARIRERITDLQD